MLGETERGSITVPNYTPDYKSVSDDIDKIKVTIIKKNKNLIKNCNYIHYHR